MSIFDEGFHDTPEIEPNQLEFRFCIYCADRLPSNASRQYCGFCKYVYAFNPYVLEEMIMSDVATDKKESKEEKYRRVFNYKKESLTVAQMGPAMLIEHIRMLESTLEDLLFEKRTEIQASRTHFEDLLERESNSERERYRKMDRDGRTRKLVNDAEARDAKPERKAPRTKEEQMIDSMMKAGLTREAAMAILAKKG